MEKEAIGVTLRYKRRAEGSRSKSGLRISVEIIKKEEMDTSGEA